jgi:hypothetical protein
MSLTAEIWPAGVGEGVGLVPSSGAGWQCLDDLSESDYVYIRNNDSLYVYSFYTMQDVSLPSNAIIENLRLSSRANRITSYGSYNGYGKLSLKIGASYYSSGWTTVPSTSMVDFYYDWATNPATGAAWTQSDINAMLAGMYMRCDYQPSWNPVPEVRAYWLLGTVTYRTPCGNRAQLIGPLW